MIFETYFDVRLILGAPQNQNVTVWSGVKTKTPLSTEKVLMTVFTKGLVMDNAQ